MGVPVDLAEYLVAMDWCGHSLVRSPMAMSMVVEDGFEKAIKDDLTFDAVRGTAQGDVASPLNWDAAFDILLSALDTVEEGRFYTQNCHYNNLRVRGNCYADDLVNLLVTQGFASQG